MVVNCRLTNNSTSDKIYHCYQRKASLEFAMNFADYHEEGWQVVKVFQRTKTHATY